MLSELNRRDLLENVSIPTYQLVIGKTNWYMVPISAILIILQIPPNEALEGLAAGMIEAWSIYNRKK